MLSRLNEVGESRSRGQEGFTLIELLIVIVVLGILAAVVVFGLSGVTGQSAVAACNADAKSVEVAVESYHAQKAAFPDPGQTGIGQLTAIDATTQARYLRTFPNSPHYAITLAANGEVDVQPLPGGAVTNYDTVTAGKNICDSVK